MTALDTDVALVGLGIHGSAAAYELTARGVGVIAVDQFADGHCRGSSHGRTRMIRRAYPSPAWNDFVARAYDGWERWSAASGQALLRRTGGLYAHRGAAQLQGPGCELVESPERIREVMPSLAVPAGYRAVYDPEAGVLDAAAALTGARAGARAAGAELVFGERMLSWTATDHGVSVVTTHRTIRAGRLVLAVGAWAGLVLPRLAGLFEVWRIVTVTLRPGQQATMPPALGAFSVERPGGLLFGVPDVAGSGFKSGIDAGPVWDPAEPPAPATEAEISALVELMTGYVPGIDPEVAEAASCLYTMTADRRFLLGNLPGQPSVLVAEACSGHGFKFGPAVGEAIADLATGVDRPDLDFISVERRCAR
jgi:glycine/D-amino acid oxidase-like deaminating enzyme